MEVYLKLDVIEALEGISADARIGFLKLIRLSVDMPCPGVLCTSGGGFRKEEVFSIIAESDFYSMAMDGVISYIMSHRGMTSHDRMIVFINNLPKYVHFPRKIRTINEGIYVLRKELGWLEGNKVNEVLQIVWDGNVPVITQKSVTSDDYYRMLSFMGDERAALVESYLERFKTQAMMEKGTNLYVPKAVRLLNELSTMYSEGVVEYRGGKYDIDADSFLEAIEKVAGRKQLKGLANHNYLKVVLLNGRAKGSQAEISVEGY